MLQAVTRGSVKVNENMPVEAPQVDVKKNVPIVLPMENAEIIRIRGLGKFPRRNALILVLKAELVRNNRESLSDRLDSFEVGQISTPKTDNSRKKSIYDPVKAFVEGRPYSVNVKETHKDKDSWQASFDDRENRVVFMIYCNP